MSVSHLSVRSNWVHILTLVCRRKLFLRQECGISIVMISQNSHDQRIRCRLEIKWYIILLLVRIVKCRTCSIRVGNYSIRNQLGIE